MRYSGKHTKKGSITVFAAISILLIASVLFVLLEAGRYPMMEKRCQENMDAAAESVFAGYDCALWEKYHLLVRDLGALADDVDISEVEELVYKVTEDCGKPRGKDVEKMWTTSFLCGQPVETTVDKYMLVTDYEGEVYQSLISSYMKESLAYEAAMAIKELYTSVEEKEDVDVDMAVQNARSQIQHAQQAELEKREQKKKEAKERGEEYVEEPPIQPFRGENPLTLLAELKTKGILSLVVLDVNQVSNEEIDLQERLSNRELEKGMDVWQSKGDVYSQMLCNQYYLTYFENYLEPAESGGLLYPCEYMICGKKSDRENLTGVVERILLMREGCNMAYLMTDAQKQAEAATTAAALAAVTANPVVVEAVKYGVLAAWAFVESVLDVRTLLAGGKIPVIKTAAEWKSQLGSFAAQIRSFGQAEQSGRGLSYDQYLGAMLYMQESKKLAFRAMDIQELYMRSLENKENFRMDRMMVSCDISGVFVYRPFFANLSVLLDGKTNELWQQSCSSSYSYLHSNDAE